MQVIEQDRTVFRMYESADEFTRFSLSVPEERLAHGTDNQYIHGCPTKDVFVGREFSDWDAVKRAVGSVWTDGIKVLERMMRDLDEASIEQPRSRRRKTRFRDDDGDELDYDRLRCGQAFWRSTRRESAKGPSTITVLVDVGANCKVKHEDILWRGAAAIALTKRLEEAGYRVELWSVSLSEGIWSPGAKVSVTVMDSVCLKRPGDPIDESTLISAVAGWFYRTFGFRAWCSGTRKVHKGLGFHRPAKPNELDHVSRDENRILVAGCFSYGKAVDMVRQAIANLKTY